MQLSAIALVGLMVAGTAWPIDAVKAPPPPPWYATTEGWIDLSISGGMYGATVGSSAAACGAAGTVAGGPVGGFAGGVGCGIAADQITKEYVQPWVEQNLLKRKLHPQASDWGRFAGSTIGWAGGTDAGIRRVWPKSFGAYSRYTRNLTERKIRASGKRWFYDQQRRLGRHIDHIRSVKCGWNLSIPAWMIASTRNLQVISANANLAKGAGSCSLI